MLTIYKTANAVFSFLYISKNEKTMKYIKLYEEHQQKLNFDFGDTIIKLYDDDNWMIVKPNSEEDFEFLAKNTNWDLDRYDDFDELYVNINKESKEKYLFDFYDNEFYDDSRDISLKDFFDENKKMAEKYGDFFDCGKKAPTVIKKDNKYWLVVSDFSDFYNFFEEDNFVKSLLSGEGYELFIGNGNSDLDQYGIKLTDNNMILMKVIILLDSINNDYVVNFDDIKTYYDIINIINTHKIKDIKSYLKRCISGADVQAKESEAYNAVLDSVYEYFGLVDGTAKWEKDPNSNSDNMWIQFNSKYNASIAKFRILDLADEYGEDLISFSQPYYGYDGDDSTRSDSFNQEISDRYDEYDGDGDAANEYAVYWENALKNNISESDIIEQIKIKMGGDVYNL